MEVQERGLLNRAFFDKRVIRRFQRVPAGVRTGGRIQKDHTYQMRLLPLIVCSVASYHSPY